MPPEAGPLVVARELAKSFGTGEARVEIFRDVALEVEAGDSVAIVGPSGCGKSTLLHLLAGLDRPDRGSVRLADASWGALDAEAAARRRGELVGFVFQFHHLLPELSAEENVALPLLLARVPTAEALRSARETLARVGLAAKAAAAPRTLSGGERQRVAIARAVVRRPSVLLCDEPTGSLDAAHAEDVFQLLSEVARERAGALVLVTHAGDLARRCARVLSLTPRGLVAAS